MERKLAAVFSADVKGYSRLMGEDEEATIRTLTAYRELMIACIQQHHGRVVDSPGDNLLAEFASAVDAVQGAVAIQKELQSRNTELPPHRQMHYRIGINVGDIIVEGERIYGDGVNIAARLESLADGGGIAISGTVYDQVKNKLAERFTYQGEQSAKNIAGPVRMYKVELDAEGAVPTGSAEPPTELPLPDNPSIAVLPFTNMSADPEQEYFSDGLTDDLITDLAKLSGLFVIARNSVFTYKGQAVKVVEVGRELGVRHVLEGSVRKVGNRVRINVQLIDAATGGHVWAERYDHELEDLFALQDEIRQKIVFTLKVTLTPEEQARFRQAPTPNLNAYDDYLRGREYFDRLTKEANTRARQLFESALERDPAYAAAYAFLGGTYWQEWIFQWNPAPEVPERAFKILQEAVGLDPSLAQTRLLLGWVYMHRKQYEEAQTEIEHARALAPNFADCYWRLGALLNCMGQPEKGLGLIEQALRLNPHYPIWYTFDLGWTYYLLGRHEEARRMLQRVLRREPHHLPAHLVLAASFSEGGYEAEARAEVAAARQVNPHFSLEIFRQRFPFKDPSELARFLTALRNAGLE